MIDIYTHTQKEKKMEAPTSLLQEPHLCHSLFHFQEFLYLFQTSQTLKKDKLSKTEMIFQSLVQSKKMGIVFDHA